MVSKRDQRIVVVGRHVSFWNAKWVGEETLCTTFNRLFLNSNKKIEILWRWDLLWRRLLFTWEQPLVQQIIDFIGDRCPTKNGNDGWMWCSNVEKKYVVKQVYGELINIEGGEDRPTGWEDGGGLVWLVFARSMFLFSYSFLFFIF